MNFTLVDDWKQKFRVGVVYVSRDGKHKHIRSITNSFGNTSSVIVSERLFVHFGSMSEKTLYNAQYTNPCEYSIGHMESIVSPSSLLDISQVLIREFRHNTPTFSPYFFKAKIPYYRFSIEKTMDRYLIEERFVPELLKEFDYGNCLV